MKKIVLLCVVFLLSACGSTVSTQPRPASYMEQAFPMGTSEEQGSLFTSDRKVISDEEIKRILEYNVSFPSQNRIAIMSLGQPTWYSGWSHEVTELHNRFEQNFIALLRASPSVYDASYLPALLIPEKRTVPYLREAAARYQADMLLLYRTKCNTYEKYRLLGADETKAYCSAEAVLLDPRSGIVPFTSVVTETFAAKKDQEDVNFYETMHKAQMTATGEALSQVAKELVKFIEMSP